MATDALPLVCAIESSDPSIATIDSTTGVLYGVFSVTGGLPVTVTYSRRRLHHLHYSNRKPGVPVAIPRHPPLICVGQNGSRISTAPLRARMEHFHPCHCHGRLLPCRHGYRCGRRHYTGILYTAHRLCSYRRNDGACSTHPHHRYPLHMHRFHPCLPYGCCTRWCVWSSSNTTVATIDAGTGIATGPFTLGSATIMYSKYGSRL